MYIENGNTLVVKSGIDYFEKERSGTKPNTIRDECNVIDDGISMGSLLFIQRIRVVNAMKPECSFIRNVTDVSYWHDNVIISWEHSNGTN